MGSYEIERYAFVNYKSSLDLVCQMYVFGKKVVQQNK